jgi:hypothetical protein
MGKANNIVYGPIVNLSKSHILGITINAKKCNGNKQDYFQVGFH